MSKRPEPAIIIRRGTSRPPHTIIIGNDGNGTIIHDAVLAPLAETLKNMVTSHTDYVVKIHPQRKPKP